MNDYENKQVRITFNDKRGIVFLKVDTTNIKDNLLECRRKKDNIEYICIFNLMHIDSIQFFPIDYGGLSTKNRLPIGFD